MIHPTEVQLALFAGGELGFRDRWRVRRHVGSCTECAGSVESLRLSMVQTRECAAELPKDLNWNRLSEEMTGNIRVGLAAGEAIAGFHPAADVRIAPRRLGWNAAMVLAGATVVFGAGFWFNLPQAQADHLLAALKRIRVERVGSFVQRPAFSQEDVVLEASSSGIGVKENGSAMTMMHPRSDGVTVSISMKGSAAVRYVDADTGQVTTNKVYYAEQ